MESCQNKCVRVVSSGGGYMVTLFLMFTLLTAGCSDTRNKADISGIEAGIDIRRFDIDLFDVDIDSIPVHVGTLEEEYGEFFEIFNHLIIRTGSSSAPAYPEHLHRFLTDMDIYRVRTEVYTVFDDISWLVDDLEMAFRHFLYYFPDYPLPEIYTYLSGFNQSVVTADRIVGIGLDKYLGADHFFYSQLQLPMYQRRIMHPGKIVPDVMMAWAMMEFEFDGTGKNLLSHIIHHGKLLYFVDAMLPWQPDTLKTGFTAQQMDWCIRNETMMWTYLVENKLLFSTDARTISGFVNPAPFTREFTSDSPGMAALWLGWQIVSSYMDRNRHVTLEELMNDDDYQKILNQARYRP